MKRTIVKSFLFFTQVKLFFDQQWQVALFGEPAQSQDGWIINLLADQVFVGDYSSLPTDVLLAADWVQARAAMKDPLAELVCHEAPRESWAERLAPLPVKSYGPADLFRDFGLECEREGSLPLAISFMQKAHELRPGGAGINAKLKRYAEALQQQ
jgi:hypothetical protein